MNKYEALNHDLGQALRLLAKSNKLDRERLLGRVLDRHLDTVQGMVAEIGARVPKSVIVEAEMTDGRWHDLDPKCPPDDCCGGGCHDA